MISTFLFSVLFSVALTKNVHQQEPVGALRRSARSTHTLRKEDLMSAVASVLGQGHDIHHGHLERVHQKVLPMWRSLPTNQFSRVDRRSLRYVVHRYFMQVYTLSIVGLEPSQVNAPHEEALLLSQVVPSYVKSELEGKAAQTGFSIDDAVVMIATLERLVEDTSHELLERAYAAVHLRAEQLVGWSSARRVLEAYMLRWMLGEDTEGIEELESNQTLLEESLEDWQDISTFVAGQLKALTFSRSRTQGGAESGAAWSEFRPRFSFEDIEEVIGSVTMTFGNFWTTECQRVKRLLIDMDHHATGRVKLSDFYGAAMNGEWRFSESKDYLRQLGALGESSTWQGPRVIITNYMQAASNCIVSAPHYRVCCANECEHIFSEIEEVIGAPLANADAILQVLANHSSPLDDNIVKLSPGMKDQLHDIAQASPGGRVPLHGRLFAQWLHYAFPRECPFPHKTGETVALSPLEFGDMYAASEEEMVAAATPNSDEPKVEPEADWMSQWSHEEELLSETTHLHAPWELRTSGFVKVLLFILTAVFAAFQVKNGSKRDLLPTSMSKTHCC